MSPEAGRSTHPHEQWTLERLDGYVDLAETVTLEFKASNALRSTDGKDRQKRLTEAAADVAAMANEQGGAIVYGMRERQEGSLNRPGFPGDSRV